MAKRVVLPNFDSGFSGRGRSLLTLNDWLGFVAVFAATFLLAGSAFAQDRRSEVGRPEAGYISGAVRDGNGQEVARTEVLIGGVRPEVTKGSGVFKFPLQRPLKVSFAYTVLLSALRPGDRRLLSGHSIGRFLEQEASQLRAKPALAQSPRSSLHGRQMLVFASAGVPDIPGLSASSAGNLRIVAAAYHADFFPEPLDPPSRASQAKPLATDDKPAGPDQPSVETILHQAGLYQQQGKYAEAEQSLKQALAIHEKALGPDHPEVAVVAENLARTLRKLGRNSEARSYQEQAARIRAKIKRPSPRGGQNPE